MPTFKKHVASNLCGEAQNNIRMLDAVLRRVANALSDIGCGAGACGGVDTENETNPDTGKPFGPGGHTGYVLEKAIRRFGSDRNSVESICSAIESMALNKVRKRDKRIQDLEYIAYHIDVIYEQIAGRE